MIRAAVSIFLQPSIKILDMDEGVSPDRKPTTTPRPINTAASSSISQSNFTEPTTIPTSAAIKDRMINVLRRSMEPNESMSISFWSFWLSSSCMGL